MDEHGPNPPQPVAPSQPGPTPPDSGSTARIVYVLHLASLVVGVTAVIGVVMAYLNQGQAPEWLRTHYRFQIRTFWIGLLYFTASIALTLALIGFPLLLASTVWLIVRCVKGLQALERRAPYPNPASWIW